MQNTLTYQEIFPSVQGESTDAGLPCLFVRLHGCNLNCSYCDQPQDKDDKAKISIEKLVKTVETFGIPYVCFTGGEPLLQWNSLYMTVLELIGKNFSVSIETNGCVPIEPDPYVRSFKYIMDVKCPSSGMSDKNILKNLMSLLPHDEVKFVVSDEEDYKYMKNILKAYPMPSNILVSPCFRDNRPQIGKDLVDWLLRDKLFHVRVQCQLHKVLGGVR